MAQSRLSRKTRSKQKRQLILTLAGLVIIAFLLFQFGLWSITGISSLIIWFNEKGQTQTDRKNAQQIINPPILSPLPQGTDKNSILINGKVTYTDGSVEVYLNDNLFNELIIGKNDFKIEVINLQVGENKIEARYVTPDGKRSAFSKVRKITYTKDQPKLEITQPADGSTFRRGDEVIDIKGKTDPENTVTINGFIAVVETDGSFSYNYKLSEGDNLITVVAQNYANIKIEKQIKAIFSP